MLKNRTTRVATLLLALTLITCCFVGSTFAKYTSTTSGNGTATVAKWDFTVEGTQIAVTGAAPTVNFDLFATIKDSNGTDAETDVAANLIAPGTSGSFEYNLANNSEVNAKYTVVLSETTNSANIPILYSLTGENGSWKEINELNASLAAKSIAMGTTDAVTVYWMWAFETTDGDNVDTAAGIAGQTTAATVTVSATITVEQVD